jgi:hypothetical protein
VVGKRVDDYRTVILVDDVVLVVASGENDGTAHCNSCTDEWGYGDIFIINKGRVDTAECDIGCFLSDCKVVVRRIIVVFLLEVA